MTIYVRISGGLGNQLFQYGFGCALESEGKSVKYDIQHYDHQGGYYLSNYGSPGFELQKIFGLAMECASAEEIKARFGNLYASSRVQRWLAWKFNTISEAQCHQFNYHPHYLCTKDGAYLSGYWQAWQYLDRIREPLQKRLRFPSIDNPALQNLWHRILGGDSVGVHVRRGDFLKSPIHQVLLPDYYASAARIVEKRFTQPSYFIFSDDVAWVKENIHFQDMEIVDINKGTQSYRDIQLMSACKALIIANSTFSWWGAWLNQSPNPLVIAPKAWISYKNAIKDIWMPSWTVI